MNDGRRTKRASKVLRFAVGTALMKAPIGVGCGGGAAEETSVNEPIHANEPMEETTTEDTSGGVGDAPAEGDSTEGDAADDSAMDP